MEKVQTESFEHKNQIYEIKSFQTDDGFVAEIYKDKNRLGRFAASEINAKAYESDRGNIQKVLVDSAKNYIKGIE